MSGPKWSSWAGWTEAEEGKEFMRDYCGSVNVFQGCDEIDLPRPAGVAAAWRFIKGRCGNNTPAAALPFGRITAGCYSGGYSSGYGRLMYNTHGEIGKLWPQNMFRGLSHLQNDGTGDIDTFYNYAVISPFRGALSGAAEARPFTEERAEPGYYACRDSATGALCEVTVTRRAALHRLSFPEGGGRVSIDFSSDGLYDDGGHLRSPAGKARLTLLSDRAAEVSADLHHLTVHFCVTVKGGKNLRLWADGAERDEASLDVPPGHGFGLVFDVDSRAEIALGLSPRSAAVARADATSAAPSFDEARAAARAAWNEALSRVDAKFDDPRDDEIFYSNMYHALVKPCDFSGESFLYDQEEFVLEFATIWDQYKTLLPFIYTLYPDMSRKIVLTMLNVAEATKKMPHTLMMCGDYEDITTSQARMLAEHSIVDAFYRGVDFDAARALRLMLADTFEHGRFDEYAAHWEAAKHKAFLIDITDACAACARMAREMGEDGAAARFEEVAALWVNAFDKETGLLKDGERFYEGTRWNYSFRLMHDMPARMALAGGPAAFAALADRFFGFVHPEDEAACCFEGFNNETDMEAPYVYHFAGRHDRLSQVIDGALRYMFVPGRGGVPGNNDSGGLCSCYLWNALGLFPVSGQDLMIVGSPRAREARMRLANGREFMIRRQGEGIYVKEAAFNGRRLPELALSVRAMMAGGELLLTMTEDAAESRLS